MRIAVTDKIQAIFRKNSCRLGPHPAADGIREWVKCQAYTETRAYLAGLRLILCFPGSGDRAVPFLSWPRTQACIRFNPLPSPKQGEIGRIRRRRHVNRSFNPLPSPKQGEILAAVTSRIPKGYTGVCAIRSNNCQELLTRLSRNARTCCYTVTFQLREYTAKTPLLCIRAAEMVAVFDQSLFKGNQTNTTKNI